jgi:hypothetical protein
MANAESTEYDRQFSLVTSYILSPLLLAGARLLIAVYALVVLIYMLIRASSLDTDLDSYVPHFLASTPADFPFVIFSDFSLTSPTSLTSGFARTSSLLGFKLFSTR